MHTVLVIDDDSNLVSALARRFHACNLRVIGTDDPVNGLAWFYEREKVDLIILDLAMPGLSGIALLRHVRQRSDVPIVVLTGAPFEDQTRALRAGATVVFEKPADEVLEAFVLSHLEATLARAEARVGSRVTAPPPPRGAGS